MGINFKSCSSDARGIRIEPFLDTKRSPSALSVSFLPTLLEIEMNDCSFADMAEVLQRSQFMEKELDLREHSKDLRKSATVARIVMSSLKSQPVDHEVNGRSMKLSVNESAEVDSEEDVDEFSPSDNSDSEPLEETSGAGLRVKWRQRPDRKRPKKNTLGVEGLGTPTAHQRNLKQKFIALLKKFKIPDSEASDSEEQAALEKELMAAAASDQLGNIEDIFEFEDSDADSAPEVDDLSVSSTPRPALKPFFSSKTTLVEEVNINWH